MDLTPTDFLGGLGGINALPNPVRDTANAQGLQANAQALHTTELVQQAQQLQNQQQQAQQQRATAFQHDIATLGDNPNPTNIAGLIRKYPEFAKQMKDAHDVQDSAKKASDFKVQAQIWSAAHNGSYDLAAQLLQQHHDASVAAGEAPDPTDTAIITALKSGDPAEQKRALGMIGLSVASIDPDKFSETYSALNKGSEGFTLNPGDVRFDADGNQVASVAAKPEYRSVKNADDSESIVELGSDGTPTQTFNGTGKQIEAEALAAVPGLTVTSRARTPEHNADVGGVPNSYHITDQARDFVPPAGMKLAELSDKLKAALPGYQVIPEKDHIHVEPAPTARFNQSGTRVIYTSKGNPGGVSGKAPSGYRFRSDGALEPIPGGPADVDKLPQEAVESMAQQYLSGDKSVMQGLGRGAQGSAAIAQVRAEIARQAKATGMTGRDIAAQMADFAGVMAASRATGTRIANVELASTEAEKLIPLALAASAALPRNGFLPFSRAQQAVESGVNNPALRKFVTANTALVNVYSRAVSPTGAPTVSDKEHARQLLDTAYDQASYKSVVDQMRAEIAAARAAPASVRSDIRASVGGGAGAPPAGAIAYLKANPQLRGAFDHKYGAGAAARALGAP